MTTVTMNPADLRKAMAFAMQAVERKNAIPILSTILFDVKADSVTVCGTNLDMECRATLPATSDKNVKFCLNPRLLARVVRDARKPITLTRDDTDTITIEADGMTLRQRDIYPAEDFPAMNLTKYEGKPFSIGEAALQVALEAVIPSISDQETRYYLNGIYLHPIEGKLRAVSTDGHRLSRYDTQEEWPIAGVILHKGACKTLHRALRPQGDAVIEALAYLDADTPSLIVLTGEGWSISAKFIDGTFPDYTRAVPTDCDDIAVTLSHAALRRFPASPFMSTCVAIHPEAGTLTVKLHGNSKDSEAVLPCAGKGGQFGVNLKYLLAMSRKPGVIRMEGRTAGDPFRVLTEDPAFMGVIMPMRV